MHPPARFSLSNASAPGRTTRYIYALRFHWKILVPLEEPHVHGATYTRPPTHRLSLSSSSLGVLRHPRQSLRTLEKRTYTLYSHPAIRATKMVVKTLYRTVFLPGNEPGLRAREILRNLRPGSKQRSHFRTFG